LDPVREARYTLLAVSKPLFGQFRKVHSANFRFTEFSEVRSALVDPSNRLREKARTQMALQVKSHRLDLTLLGQAFFAVRLLERLRPASIRGVALCTQDDEALREVFEAYPNMEVEIAATI
jgi:hypothetical protein